MDGSCLSYLWMLCLSSRLQLTASYLIGVTPSGGPSSPLVQPQALGLQEPLVVRGPPRLDITASGSRGIACLLARDPNLVISADVEITPG
jgi:hypothetical protein